MSVFRCVDRKLCERIKVYKVRKGREGELSDEELVAFLQAKILGGAAEMSLERLLRSIRFDPRQRDPVERVGLVFQTGDYILEEHGILNHFT